MEWLNWCPFCGGKPTTDVMVVQSGSDMDLVDFRIVCQGCGTYKTARLKIVRNCTFEEVESAMRKAGEAWNTRWVTDDGS